MINNIISKNIKTKYLYYVLDIKILVKIYLIAECRVEK